MSLFLAIDASEQYCSVTLADATMSTCYSRAELAPRKHSELLLPMVDAVLAEAAVDLSAVSAITFSQGPGAFTGIRIATAAVQGLAYAAQKPVIPVSTLALKAFQAYSEMGTKNLLVALDARMDEIYFAAYCIDSEGCIASIYPDCVIKPGEIDWRVIEAHGNDKEWFGVGSGWCYNVDLTANSCLTINQWEEHSATSASFLIPLAVQAFKLGLTLSAAQVQPVYLRNSVAWNKA